MQLLINQLQAIINESNEALKGRFLNKSEVKYWQDEKKKAEAKLRLLT
jgi:hypothetical protein